jgi:hypothetical protein
MEKEIKNSPYSEHRRKVRIPKQIDENGISASPNMAGLCALP